jgi:hypothetical protein
MDNKEEQPSRGVSRRYRKIPSARNLNIKARATIGRATGNHLPGPDRKTQQAPINTGIGIRLDTIVVTTRASMLGTPPGMMPCGTCKTAREHYKGHIQQGGENPGPRRRVHTPGKGSQ